MRWNLFHQLEDGWQWECIDDDGEIEARAYGFATHAECMADAVRHGYPCRLPDEADGARTADD
jgi:hypothetical protein